MSLTRRHGLLIRVSGGYSAEVQAIIARFTGGNALTAGEVTKIVTFLDDPTYGLNTLGYWNNKIDEIWIPKIFDSKDKAKIGLKAYTLTEIGTVTFDANGFSGFSSSKYFRTGLIARTFGGHYSLDDAMLFSQSSSAANGYTIGVNNAAGANNARLNPGTTNNAGLNTSTLFNYLGSSVDKLAVITRTSSNRMDTYIDGGADNNNSGVSTATPNIEFYVGVRNNNGTPTGQMGGALKIVGVGSAVGIDQAKFNTAIVNLLT